MQVQLYFRKRNYNLDPIVSKNVKVGGATQLSDPSWSLSNGVTIGARHPDWLHACTSNGPGIAYFVGQPKPLGLPVLPRLFKQRPSDASSCDQVIGQTVSPLALWLTFLIQVRKAGTKGPDGQFEMVFKTHKWQRLLKIFWMERQPRIRGTIGLIKMAKYMQRVK